jgi:hypothetical protein
MIAPTALLTLLVPFGPRAIAPVTICVQHHARES